MCLSQTGPCTEIGEMCLSQTGPEIGEMCLSQTGLSQTGPKLVLKLVPNWSHRHATCFHTGVSATLGDSQSIPEGVPHSGSVPAPQRVRVLESLPAW